MTQFESTFESGDVGEQKTSGLAVASLVCSLICCVPVTTIPGILLGIGAMVSISRNAARKGMALAVIGILLGVIFTGGQFFVYRFFYEVAVLVMNGPTDALTAGFANDPGAFKMEFYGTGAQATDAEVQAFIDTLRSRYGEFQDCRFNEQTQTQPGGFGQPSTVFPYILTFDNATVDAEAEAIWVDERTGDMILKWGSVIVTDSDLGDLRYPLKKMAPTGTTPPPPEPTDDPEPADAAVPADAPPPTRVGGPDEGDGG